MKTNLISVDIIQDLKTFTLQDLDTLIKYYKIDPDQEVLKVLAQIANKIYKTGNLSASEINNLFKHVISSNLYDTSLTDLYIKAVKQGELRNVLKRLFYKLIFYGYKRKLNDKELELIEEILKIEKININDNYNKDLIRMFNNNTENSKKVIDLLSKYGYDLNMYDFQNRNKLFPKIDSKRTASITNPEIVLYLMNKGVDINHIDNMGNKIICYINYINYINNGKNIDKELLKIYFKYIDFDLYQVCHEQSENTLVNGKSNEQNKIMLEVFKEAYEEKLEPLQELYDLLIDALEFIAPNHIDQIKNNLNDIKIQEPVYLKPHYKDLVSIEEFDNVKLKYENDKQILESKIKYLFDTLELYPGGKKYKELKKDFENKMRSWKKT